MVAGSRQWDEEHKDSDNDQWSDHPNGHAQRNQTDPNGQDRNGHRHGDQETTPWIHATKSTPATGADPGQKALLRGRELGSGARSPSRVLDLARRNSRVLATDDVARVADAVKFDTKVV